MPLVADENDMIAGMAEMMKAKGREMPVTERILELNQHPLVTGIEGLRGDQPDHVHLQTLRDQAILAEGGRIDDGAVPPNGKTRPAARLPRSPTT